MEISLCSGDLSARVDPLGAELQSLTVCGRELLWCGDAAYWSGRSPLLFPFVARLKDGVYRYGGHAFDMDIHGFAKDCRFEVAEQRRDRVVLRLRDSALTLAQYPFHFVLLVSYRLTQQGLRVEYRIGNTGDRPLFFAIGGHPGFALPLEEGLSFSDYRLVFGAPCVPARITFSERLLVTGETVFPLEEGCLLRLSHSLFDDDAIVLRGTSDAVTLCSDKGTLALRMEFAGFPYLGLWHAPRTRAPYLCIEPWSALPACDSGETHLETKPDLIRLEPGGERCLDWRIGVVRRSHCQT